MISIDGGVHRLRFLPVCTVPGTNSTNMQAIELIVGASIGYRKAMGISLLEIL
jgi:hypothetical protein